MANQHIKMKEDDIVRILRPMCDAAEQWQEEKSDERIRCYRYYHQQHYGNERDGWSQTVASTVFDVIEWLKPGLNEIFASPDFFSLSANPNNTGMQAEPSEEPPAMGPEGMAPGQPPQPAGPSPYERSEKLKQYVRFLLFRQQDGEAVIDDFVADTLLYHNGVLKTYYFEEFDTQTIELKRMTMEEFHALQTTPDVTITRYQEVQEFDRANNYYWEGVENVKAVRRVKVFAGPRVEVVPPWEFYTLPGEKDIDRNTPYVEHRVKKKMADIKKGEAQGRYKKGSYERIKDKLGSRIDYNPETSEEVRILYSVDNLDYDGSDDMTWQPAHEKNMVAANEVYVREIYAMIDVDKDGMLEHVIVSLCEDMVIQIQNNPYKRPPFRVSSVYRQPHRLEGKPLPLVLEDDQKELTNLHRLMTDASADSAYGTLITDDVMLAKDWSERQVGDVLIGQHDRFKEVRPKPPSNSLLQAIEKRETKVEQKSGVSRYNQGIDANSLNKTATGINLIQTAGQQRQKFIAKRIGRTFKQVLRDIIFIIQKWPPEDVVKLLGTDLELSPDDVAGKYDIEIDVGVGPQDRIDQAGHLDAFIQFMSSAGIQLGIGGPEHILKALRRKGKLIGVPFSDLLLDDDQFDTVQQAQQTAQEATQQLEQVTQALQQLQQQAQPPFEQVIANLPQIMEGRAKQMAQQMLQPHAQGGQPQEG